VSTPNSNVPISPK